MSHNLASHRVFLVATIRNDFLTREREYACLSLGGKESKQRGAKR